MVHCTTYHYRYFNKDLMHSKYDSETLKCNELKFEKCILTGSFLPLLDILPAAS